MHLLELPWDAITSFISLIVHLDQHIHEWVNQAGGWIYIVTFTIIFLETGAIIFPFLPGDSLLFALGAVAAAAPGSILQTSLLVPILIVAAFLGGLINYATGSYIGPKIFQNDESKWFRRSHLLKTQAYYEKHGGKTIVLARFIPIFRTFVPFVAGIGRMDYKRFIMFNFVGAMVWIILLVNAGSYLGNIPIVKRNFGVVVPMIIVISILPVIFEVTVKKFRKTRS